MRGFKHGHAPKGQNPSPTWMCWHNMKNRCYNPNCEKYAQYGGRGIDVCQEWREDFRAFLRDMGEQPEGYTIDRIDSNKGYFKANCQWACLCRQAHNRTDNKLDWDKVSQIRHMAEEGFLHREIAVHFGVHRATVSKVLRGTSWKPEKPIVPAKEPEKKVEG